MALNTANLLDYSFDLVRKADDLTMGAWSGLLTTVLSVTHFAPAGFTMDQKALRTALRAGALDAGVNENTFNSYIKFMFEGADKLYRVMRHDPRMATLGDQDDVGACTDVEAMLYSLNVSTGGHIRDWCKQDGDVYDPNAAKAKRTAKQEAGAADLLAKLRANRSTDSSTISDTAPVSGPVSGPVDTKGAALAAIEAVTSESDMLALLAAVNTKLAAFAAMKAQAPAPAPAPVLADAVVPAPGSHLAKVAERVAAKAA